VPDGQFKANPKYIALKELNELITKILKSDQLDSFYFDDNNYIHPKDDRVVKLYRDIVPMVAKKLILNPFSVSGINIPCYTSEAVPLLFRMAN